MLHPTPLYRQLADLILESIRTGTLRVGDRVPSVRRLSKQHDVSVSTVLQAYQRLEDSRVIEARPQSGYYVRHLPVAIMEPESSRPPRRALKAEVNALVETVLASAADPTIVSFGAACAEGELFPLERVRRMLSSLARRDRAALGRYGLPPGAEALRRAVARRALDWGCQLDHRNIVTTNGCTESINLCLRAVTRPGDLVALESPTYFGFLQILQVLGLRALEIPTHPRTGISLDALGLAISEHPVKAVLVMPNVSNPLGATMSNAAKERLVTMLAAKKIPLIEDHVYADLIFTSSAPRAAKAYDRVGNVMFCSSCSKTFSPGLKAGWIEPGRWGEQIRMLKFVASGGHSEIIELALAELLESGGYERSLRQLRRRFRFQVETARAIIAESFPRGTRATQPSGAYIVWVEFPESLDSVVLFERLLDRGISIAPGPMFSASQRYRNCIRLGLGKAWSARHERALREVGAVARELCASA